MHELPGCWLIFPKAAIPPTQPREHIGKRARGQKYWLGPYTVPISSLTPATFDEQQQRLSAAVLSLKTTLSGAVADKRRQLSSLSERFPGIKARILASDACNLGNAKALWRDQRDELADALGQDRARAEKVYPKLDVSDVSQLRGVGGRWIRDLVMELREAAGEMEQSEPDLVDALEGLGRMQQRDRFGD